VPKQIIGIMKRLKTASGFAMSTLVIAVLASSFETHAAHAEESMMCQPTLDTLPKCISHHYEKGQIHNKAIYKLLLAEANAAIYAHEHGHDETAVKILMLFIKQVKAFTPNLIDPEAADHMIHHATASIEQLRA
jgi:hypothetical protein